MSDDIEKARAAHAALSEALRVCQVAGVRIGPRELPFLKDDADVVEACVRIASARIASAERRAIPLALHGVVRVICDRFSNNSRRLDYVVTKVGREYVYVRRADGVPETAFRLEGGVMKDSSSAQIHPDDLFRIQRDLVQKKGSK